MLKSEVFCSPPPPKEICCGYMPSKYAIWQYFNGLDNYRLSRAQSALDKPLIALILKLLPYNIYLSFGLKNRMFFIIQKRVSYRRLSFTGKVVSLFACGLNTLKFLKVEFT